MHIRKQIKITNIYTELFPFFKTGIIKILKSRSVTMFCLY